MKKIILGLSMALTIATPAAASWKSELFTKLDSDKSGEITIAELTVTGCKFNPKFFAYADKDRSKGLSKPEFYDNREFFSRCK